MQQENKDLKKELTENENNESLKKDIFDELKEVFKRQYDKKFENLQCEIKDLKNKMDCSEKKHEKDLMEQDEKLKNLQQENKDLKKEITELKEKPQDKTVTNETNDNLTQEAQINPNDYHFENEILVKKEVKEEVINEVTVKEEPMKNNIRIVNKKYRIKRQ